MAGTLQGAETDVATNAVQRAAETKSEATGPASPVARRGSGDRARGTQRRTLPLRFAPLRLRAGKRGR